MLNVVHREFLNTVLSINRTRELFGITKVNSLNETDITRFK